MDYDKIFEEDINKKFFYSDYPGRKLYDGTISLQNAIARMSMDEFYTLVTYTDGEELPAEYVPMPEFSESGTLFATANPNNHYIELVRGSKIQRITLLPSTDYSDARYLLGPGPDVITQSSMIMDQYNSYIERQQAVSEEVTRGM